MFSPCYMYVFIADIEKSFNQFLRCCQNVCAGNMDSCPRWSRPAGVPPDEAAALASFMRKCMRLDPADRATAEELLGDPWFEGI